MVTTTFTKLQGVLTPISNATLGKKAKLYVMTPYQTFFNIIPSKLIYCPKLNF